VTIAWGRGAHSLDSLGKLRPIAVHGASTDAYGCLAASRARKTCAPGSPTPTPVATREKTESRHGSVPWNRYASRTHHLARRREGFPGDCGDGSVATSDAG